MTMGQKKRIGVISIHQKPQDIQNLDFDKFYNSFGKNTGNYMFTTAMYRQLDGDVRQLGFMFDPAKVNANFDAIVIPAANWLSWNAQWDWFSDLIEQLEIPVVTIGLGVQAGAAASEMLNISASGVRLAQLLGHKGKYISARGAFTAGFLNSIGVMNVVVTGCPSLYMAMDVEKDPRPGEGLVVQPTRYFVTEDFVKADSINRNLFRFAARNGVDIVYQSEPEEIEYLLYKEKSNFIYSAKGKKLMELYGFESFELMLKYIESHGRLFLMIDDWSRYLQQKAMIVGTRLHGAILALNSGVPAVLFGHDSRTAELIEFARIPTAKASLVELSSDIGKFRKIASDEACRAFYDAREYNGRIYRHFLTANGLAFNEAALF